MVYPWEKAEFIEADNWIEKSRNGELDVIPCIAGWMDVCGFGAALEECSWNLVQMQQKKILELLSAVYQHVGHPFLIGVEPMPFESILVINDGIARTVDLNNRHLAQAHQFVFYIRDLLFAHRMLLGLTGAYGYGVRTVFSGGERVQYSPTIFTGNSILQHDENNISEFGKSLLKKNFLYNPSEFQMNTAFAKAYSIDALGTKSGFEVNGFYIDDSYWRLFNDIPLLQVEHMNSSIMLHFNNIPALQVYFSGQKNVAFKGMSLNVQKVQALRLTKEFEGEETYCDITQA